MIPWVERSRPPPVTKCLKEAASNRSVITAPEIRFTLAQRFIPRRTAAMHPKICPTAYPSANVSHPTRKILLDLGAIKSGGGAQLALNFCEYIRANPQADVEWYAILPPSGPLAGSRVTSAFSDFAVSPASLLGRVFFDYSSVRKRLKHWKIDLVFTFFGAGLPVSDSVRSFVSTAYPIICYPDSPYWSHVAMVPKFKKRVINMARRKRLGKASTILVETEVMKNRIASALAIEPKRLVVLPPALTSFLERTTVEQQPHLFRFLMISGIDQHKNLWRLPHIAQCLQKRGITNFQFDLTVTRESFDELLIRNAIVAEYPRQHFNFLGSVDPAQISEAYQDCHCLVSLSDLESFSNNYMEAWVAGRPIIASDRDFSRHICKESALYVEPHDPLSVANAISTFMEDIQLRRRLLAAAEEPLSQMKTVAQRQDELMRIILSAH